MSAEEKTRADATLERMVTFLRAGIPGRTAPHPGLADRWERLSFDQRMEWMYDQYGVDVEILSYEVVSEALQGWSVSILATDEGRRRVLREGLDGAITTIAQEYVADMMSWPAHQLAAMVTQFGAGPRRRRGEGGLARWNRAVERARRMSGYRGRATRGTPLHALATRLARSD